MAYPYGTAAYSLTAIPPPARPQPPVLPPQPDAGQPTPASAYQARQPVWVHRHGQWRPGVALLDGGATALLVRYRYTDGRATAVDTVPAEAIRERTDHDPVLDRYPRGGQLTAQDPTLRPTCTAAVTPPPPANGESPAHSVDLSWPAGPP